MFKRIRNFFGFGLTRKKSGKPITTYVTKSRRVVPLRGNTYFEYYHAGQFRWLTFGEILSLEGTHGVPDEIVLRQNTAFEGSVSGETRSPSRMPDEVTQRQYQRGLDDAPSHSSSDSSYMGIDRSSSGSSDYSSSSSFSSDSSSGSSSSSSSSD